MSINNSKHTSREDFPIILIPAYNPDQKLVFLVEKLINEELVVVVVNDGSNENSLYVFENLQEKAGCDVVHHKVNLGKGRALKTGINHILLHYSRSLGVVTADADGQHLVEDILKCAKELKNHKNSFVLGCRNFNSSHIPFKSRFGNKLTEFVFKAFVGIKITDTQTGLRAFDQQLMKSLMNTPGERFEFETHMLIEAHKGRKDFREVPIETVYINDNAATNFRPIIDSFKIYAVILKYLFSSVSSFMIDYSVFSLLIILDLFDSMSNNILLATWGARGISSVFNYAMNKSIVFQNNDKGTFLRYYSLVIIQFLCSFYSIRTLYYLGLSNVFILKILVDVILFFMSFYIQREWVFNNKKLVTKES